MIIRLEGIEEHPRYNKSHIIGRFNEYMEKSFYRTVIVIAIQDPYKYRDYHNLINKAIEEAELLGEALPADEVEFSNFKELLYEFLSSESLMERYRGALFEQVIRFWGYFNNDNQKMSLEEVKVFCDEPTYNNGEGDKDVDIIFFENGIRTNPGIYEVNKFFAYELKCNINSFVTGILKAIKNGKELMTVSNYQKLLYLKNMSITFCGLADVMICSIKQANAITRKFWNEHNLESVHIRTPLIKNIIDFSISFNSLQIFYFKFAEV